MTMQLLPAEKCNKLITTKHIFFDCQLAVVKYLQQKIQSFFFLVWYDHSRLTFLFVSIPSCHPPPPPTRCCQTLCAKHRHLVITVKSIQTHSKRSFSRTLLEKGTAYASFRQLTNSFHIL